MYQWRSSNTRKPQKSSSNNSTLQSPLRPRLSNVIPSGTVASRVRFLESRPSAISTLPRRPSPNRGHVESRLGFGRRLANRFGKPASRNEYPDEEPRVNTIHSFLGLNTKRTKHLQEHGITDGGSDTRRTTYISASEINVRLQPQALAQSVEYGRLSPSSFTPHNRSIASKLDHSSPEMSLIEEVDDFRNGSFFTRRNSIFPTLTAGTGHSVKSHRDVKSRHENTLKSDMSTVTTSTVRRQSVRDLFADYGIDRPVGLVSDNPGADDSRASKQVKSKVRCVNCSWYNHWPSNWCFKCEYLLRTLMHEESSPSLVSPRGEQYYIEKVSDEQQPSSTDSAAKENLPTNLSPSHQVHPMQAPEFSETAKRSSRQFRKRSSGTTNFPSFNMAQSPPKSYHSPPRKVTVLELPVASRLLQGSCTTSIVKNSPFLIADRLSSGRSSIAPSPAPRMDGGLYYRNTRSKLHLHQEAIQSDADCESMACRATHEDHEPYRHSVACSSKTKRNPDNAGIGYLRSELVEGSHQSLGSEYIECYGYPRTGHARHGSATSAVVGQCQHCIDDCECSACQNTHHSVRCCLNENHRGMVHHHHAPKALINKTNPLECPTFSLQADEQVTKSQSQSTTQNASIINLSPRQSKISIPAGTNVSQAKLKLQALSKKPTEKSRPLPKSKRSTFFTEKSKPPTPPPWVSEPRIKAKTPSTTAVSKLRAEQAAADIAMDVRVISDSPPPFQAPPPFPLPATYDKTSSERAPSRRDSESRATSNAFSDLFRIGEKNTVPLLNRRLLEHQEELKKIEKRCDERISALSEESMTHENGQSNAETKGMQQDGPDKERSAATGRASKTSKSKRMWGLSLVDKIRAPPCPNDAPAPEHTLDEDETVDEKRGHDATVPEPVPEHNLSEDQIVDEKGKEIRPPKWADSSTTVNRTEKQDRIWRNRIWGRNSENRSRDQERCSITLQGVTVVVHMQGKDDLVIETDLRKGVELGTGGY